VIVGNVSQSSPSLGGSLFADLNMRLSLSILLPLLAVCFVLSITAGVSLGAAPIPFSTVWSIVGNKLHAGTFPVSWSSGQESIVWDVRFPRVVLAALVGAGLPSPAPCFRR
jgi:iron complex transport system permease protein